MEKSTILEYKTVNKEVFLTEITKLRKTNQWYQAICCVNGQEIRLKVKDFKRV